MTPARTGPRSDVTLALLAGGEGSRMGKPKGELIVRGVPLAEHVLRQLSWNGPTLLVTAPGREHPPGAAAFDREVTDPQPGAGPLQGILTALEHAATPLLVVAAVDMPRVSPDQLDWLISHADADPAAAGLFCRNLGQLEPLPCVMRTSLAAGAVREALASGNRSIRFLLQNPAFRAIDAPADWPASVWTNLNDPAAWQAFIDDAT